ncbi:hypothetical protein B0H12DRAFT_986538, partial [Mycena haematopus]
PEYTDNALETESAYLRWHCFNCQNTSPTSWRHSALYPSKILCNRCGSYEHTYLRSRPLSFDELR